MRLSRRWLWTLLLAATARGEPAQPDVAVAMKGGGAYQVEGSFEAPAQRSVVWRVLTDYAGMSGFVGAVRESRMLERRANAVVVDQEVEGTLLFFSKRVRLRLAVVESGDRQISFKDVLGRDFDSYAGLWLLEEVPGGVRVLYRLNARPRFLVPAFVARGAFRRSARELLGEIRAEIMRRAEI